MWAPPAFFLVFSILVTPAAPDTAPRIFYGLMSLVTAFWFTRSRRVGVEETTEGVAVRGQIRTRRFLWSELGAAQVEPMRTASPLYRWLPYWHWNWNGSHMAQENAKAVTKNTTSDATFPPLRAEE